MDGLKLVPIAYGDQHALQKQGLFLYDLLLERSPEVNISHREVPPFFKHLEFISSRPYAVWNVIELNGVPIGSIYLTRGEEIGIFLSRHYQGMGIAKTAIQLMMDQNPRTKYYANIAPSNGRSQRFFSRLGFKCVQHTYAMEPGCAA